jgi:hypothetical protein
MLELLADVGVIRPLMLQSLLKVRNEVEYNDASPPDVIRCNEFADAVWYLLKTTDSMLEVGRTDIAFRPEGEPRNNPQVWFSLSIEYKPTLKVEFRGQMPRGEIRQSSEAGCFELDLDPTFLKNRKQDGGEQEFLMGQLMLTADHRKEVLKAAFNVVA